MAESEYFDQAPIAMLLLNEQGCIVRQNVSCEQNLAKLPLNEPFDESLDNAVWSDVIDFYSMHPTSDFFETIVHFKQDRKNKTYLLRISQIILKTKKHFIVALILDKAHPLFALRFLDQFPLAVALINTMGKFVHLNQAYALLLKKNKAELADQNEFDFTFFDDIDAEKNKRAQLSTENYSYVIDKRYLVDNQTIWVRSFVELINAFDCPYLLIAVVDISTEINKHTNLVVAEQQLRKLIEYDALTKVKSRRAMDIEIQEALTAFINANEPSVLVFLDVDGFKKINDKYGHQMGDQVLKIIGEHLIRNIRVTDDAGRMGGDEFVILLRRSTKVDVEKILKRLSNPITVQYEGISITISLSVGASAINKYISSSTKWLNLADRAMYLNKQSKNL